MTYLPSLLSKVTLLMPERTTCITYENYTTQFPDKGAVMVLWVYLWLPIKHSHPHAIMYCIIYSNYSSIFYPCLIIILHNQHSSWAVLVVQSWGKWQRICMLCQEENNSLTATLEQSKNTKITTLQMATAFQRIHVTARIYKHHCMSWNCQKTGKYFMKAGACFEIGNIVIMNNKLFDQAFVW